MVSRFGSLCTFQENNDETVGFGRWTLGTQHHQNNIKTNGFFIDSHICKCMIFDDIFHLYEFQEKQNIEY